MGLLDWQESEQRARRGHETMNDRARDRARLLSLSTSTSRQRPSSSAIESQRHTLRHPEREREPHEGLDSSTKKIHLNQSVRVLFHSMSIVVTPTIRKQH